MFVDMFVCACVHVGDIYSYHVACCKVWCVLSVAYCVHVYSVLTIYD